MKRFMGVLTILAAVFAGTVYAREPWVPVQLFDEETATGCNALSQVNTHQFPSRSTWELVTFGNLSTFEVTIDASIRCVVGSYYPISTLTEASAVLFRGIDFAGYQCACANLRSISGSGSVSVWLSPREDTRH